MIVQVSKLIKTGSLQCQASGSHVQGPRGWKTLPAVLHRGNNAVLLVPPVRYQSCVIATYATCLRLSQLMCQQMHSGLSLGVSPSLLTSST